MEAYKFYDVKGIFGNKYSINILGEIYCKKSNRLLKTQLDTTGYKIIKFNYFSLVKKKYIHKLIAEIFIPNFNPELYTVIDHIDKNKTNNCLTNLRWVSISINNRNRILPSRKHFLPTGVSKRKNRYISTISIEKKKKFLGSYKTIAEAAIRYQRENEKYLTIY